MKPVIDYTLYLVTDRDLMSTGTLVEAVEAACAGGVTLVQLREKHVTREEYETIARDVKRICDAYDVPLIINDSPEVAVAVGAAGVHVGQEDLEASRRHRRRVCCKRRRSASGPGSQRRLSRRRCHYPHGHQARSWRIDHR